MANKIFDKMFLNVLLLGFAFMFIFTAFQTCGMIQKVVLTSMAAEYPGYSGDGYISLAIVYAVFALSNWFAPSIVSWVGPKFSMFGGGITYALFITNFFFHETWGLYFASVLIGIGASVIWTGQGTFLTINSDSETMARNSGVFWALLQCSLIFGNAFFYIEVQGKNTIDTQTRLTIFAVLLSVCIIGLALVLFLRNGKPETLTITGEEEVNSGPKQAFFNAFELLRTRKMLLLSLAFFYTGIELSFFSGVYSSCIGFTKRLGEDSAKYVGISGIFIGLGEIIGGTVFGLLGKKTNKYGRDPIILLGYLFHMACFYLIFINLPANSQSSDTYKPAYITSSIYLALFCSFGLGFGDACYNTQVYSLLGSVYADDSAPAFALFKFSQSVAAAIAFFYATSLQLPYQLLILVITGTIGTVAFWLVEWKTHEENALKANEEKNAREVE